MTSCTCCQSNEQCCFNSTPDPFNGQTANFILKPPKELMLKKPIWSAIETAMFYYSGDMYSWSSLLLMHTVAHSTRPSFRHKTNNQLLKKFLSLAVSWVKVVNNCKILTFKVNFLCQKLSEPFYFFFIEEYHFRGRFLVIDIFWALQFLNHDFYSTDRKTWKLFKGLFVVFGSKGMPGRMCDSVC